MTLRKVPDRSLVGAVRTELDKLGQELANGALAAVALHVAGRLDAVPSDRDAVGLARELRIALTELHRQAGTDSDEIGGIVARIGNSALGH